MKKSRITVLVLEPGREPYMKEIVNRLESYQEIVGGYIQALYPFEDPVALICNEDGKLFGLPWNRALRDEDGFIYDVIVGTCLVVSMTEDDFCSLPQELVDKYTEMFRYSF